ncbi:hypothetical protein CAPTEDRAFT_228940 [Capitella teleta]|uniref:Serine aminopeptidase S33 domain-containing protein n=1 Tax=Capitella teleta TaxID=283909 RepID=R7TBL5_CAPTE|nr:hypothetical protein CAPTEDRAFT_228940 [Capitella teleta]|eukprot:ELT90862.1 hypothetical protein CAPTEDRAFT_228940 [Capitella teleta]
MLSWILSLFGWRKNNRLPSSAPPWESIPHFTNAVKQRLRTKYWEEENPRAVVFILHGAGEHCQWYDVIAKPLNAQGITVCAHDHVGHGMSEGDRVHINAFSDYTRDVVQHLDIIHKKYPESPVFLLGHSMGGTIAIKTLLDYKDLPVKGVILIGPAVLPNPETVSPVKVFLAKVASKLGPQLEISPIKPEWVCRDAEVVKKYTEDPLVWHGGLKARMASELIDAMEDLSKRLAEFTHPFLLLHGTDDKLCDISGADLFDKETGSTDKTYKKFEGAYHQLHNEPEGVGPQCIQEIVDWVVHHM